MSPSALRRTVLALAIAACLPALAASSAHAARGMEVALQDDAQFLSETTTVRQAAFAHARALGAASLRTNVPWAGVVSEPAATTAPAAPTYDFSRYDRLVDEAAANGIRVQLTLAGPAPAWATGDRRIGTDRPDPARFAHFTGAVAAHFAGRVRAVSIWNEPNWHGLLKPERICGKVTAVKKLKRKNGKVKRKTVRRKVCVKTSARRYRALYRSGYAAIKAVAPGLPVWIGETNPYVNRRKQSTAPLAWLRQLTCADKLVKGCTGTLRADGYAHHPYAFDRSPSAPRAGRDNVTIATLGKLARQLAKLKRRIRISGGGSIYLTEFAYYSSGPNAKPQKKRAAWTRQAFEIALKAPKVRQLLYYQLIDPPTSMTWRTGLISSRGVKHAAYRALAGFASARRAHLTRALSPFGLPPAPAG